MKTESETPETDAAHHAVIHGGDRFSFPEHARKMERERNKTEKALNYYRSVVEKIRPTFVPARVRLKNLVTGDLPLCPVVAVAGEHDCESNQWGAISVISNTGARLGIKPHEFEVVAWRLNEKFEPCIAEAMAEQWTLAMHPNDES